MVNLRLNNSLFDFFGVIIDGANEEMKKKPKKKIHWFNLFVRFKQFHQQIKLFY